MKAESVSKPGRGLQGGPPPQQRGSRADPTRRWSARRADEGIHEPVQRWNHAARRVESCDGGIGVLQQVGEGTTELELGAGWGKGMRHERVDGLALLPPPKSALSENGPEEKPAGSFRLSAPYPNPANPSASISFSTRRSGPVTLAIYNLQGRRVRGLVNSPLGAGAHTGLARDRRLRSPCSERNVRGGT